MTEQKQDDPPQERPQDRPVDLGLFGRVERPAIGAIEVAALALSLVWVTAVIGYRLMLPEGAAAPGVVMMAVAIVLPLAVIWLAVSTARSVRLLRGEARVLQAAVDAMRKSHVAQQQGGARAVERKPDEPRHAPGAGRQAAPALPRPAAAEDEPRLALGTPAEEMRPPISVADFITALNFPESAEDKAGFRALRLALEDRSTAKLVRSAQDVLTLLSQDGIYMDDLRPERARPELWRRFAQGERGRTIAALGGVRDRASLALTAGRMREDPVFRDAAHHFLRQFDRTFQEFEPNASDADLAEMAETRTVRAFMLCGRVSGTFD